MWQDTRVTEYLPKYLERPGVEFFRSRTGLPLSSYFSSLKIRWILDNVARARELAEAGHALFGNIDTFLVWQLTGGTNGGLHVTDVTNASRTQLMNLDTLDWSGAARRVRGSTRNAASIRSSSERRHGRAEPIAGVPFAGISGPEAAS